MIRDVVVGGFDVGGFAVGGFDVGGFAVCGVEVGGFVDEGVVLGAVDDDFVVGMLGTESGVDLLAGTDDWEPAEDDVTLDGPDSDVVTTDGVAVTGTRPLLVGSAAGSELHADSTRAAPAITATARLLNCVMNLPDPPAEQPPGLLLHDVGDYLQSTEPARVVHTIHPLDLRSRTKTARSCDWATPSHR